jgi:NDP-sugar pyrophosphorylase family protein
VKAGIIAAGDGSRLAGGGVLVPKPLVPVAGRSLIHRTLENLIAAGVSEVTYVVNEKMRHLTDAVDALGLPVHLHPIVKTTPSSMHSLAVLMDSMPNQRFILCTVDSIIPKRDFQAFVRAFRDQPHRDLMLSYTGFVDDENPLRIAVGSDGKVLALGEAASASPFVTLGLYGIGPKLAPLLHTCIQSGRQRLRTFLAEAIAAGMEGVGFPITKGIDVDRPSDITVAEAFLRDQGGCA